MNTNANSAPAGKELSSELRDALIAIGRGLGTISVYGTNHPSVDQIISQTFEKLQKVFKNGNVTIGSFNGALTIDEEPVTVHDIPIRTLEKRLIAMKVSHLVLHADLSEEELKQLFIALCAQSGEAMKETLAQNGLKHVKMEDVKYVTLRNGEKKSGAGDSGTATIPQTQVSQIVAFLKGQPGSTDPNTLKKAITDPEKLGQMILEAAAIRQSNVDVQNGESLADIVIGCLRRTYNGLLKEEEFDSPRGKANLIKAMMLLEKSVLDKIHKSLGENHPEMDRKIMKAIREMEEERHFDVLSSHYLAQSEKLDAVESKMVEAIKNYGAEKAIQQFKNAGIPKKDWQQLLVQAGETPETSGSGMPSVDMSALAIVLDKLEGLMQIETQDPAQMKTLTTVTKNGVTSYTDRIEKRIEELEEHVKLQNSKSYTIKDHADHLDREDLMLEISNLTLALVQPLTVVNASVEAARKYVTDELPSEMLDLAFTSGERMQALSKRMMILVGYPTLEKTK